MDEGSNMTVGRLRPITACAIGVEVNRRKSEPRVVARRRYGSANDAPARQRKKNDADGPHEIIGP